MRYNLSEYKREVPAAAGKLRADLLKKKYNSSSRVDASPAYTAKDKANLLETFFPSNDGGIEPQLIIQYMANSRFAQRSIRRQ
ncbi:hypothetical protein EVAR_14054_1 [Eumeta japonica]|uniref:Uncharacterized protein n=1 Tax=Eumeta variegata TaxID=151549 RepID=A0A4C1UPI6_EUMVA|nr:hypothetical protein EVAR_14054_1 [Eumeta japonica]